MYLAHHELGSVEIIIFIYFIIKLVACRRTRACWYQLCLGAMRFMRQMAGIAQRSSGKTGPEDIHMSNARFVLET